MSASQHYFGTDGIRGRVGGEVINPEFVLKLGWAAGRVMASGDYSKIVIGKDTRISGYMLESALEAGFSAAGIDVLLTGPVPTPAVAYLTRTLHACAGVMISASHNLYYDNGIKFFDANGYKLSDEVELAIESAVCWPMQTVIPEELGKAHRVDNADARYIEACKASVSPDLSLSGIKVVVDCANGAAYGIAPKIFSEMGAEVITVGVAPDGLNINLDCGATSLKVLQQQVISHQADVGIALDGDADRVMMVDHTGAVVDGDQIIYMLARSRLSTDTMRGPVVGTLMSNLGLELAVRGMGLMFIREGIGDRHVMRRLIEEAGILGGEPSGHIICLDKTTTGDGIVAALQVLQAMVMSGESLASLRQGMDCYPQVTVNISVSSIMKPEQLQCTQNLVDDATCALGGCGRVLLRPSGTEPVVRVMVEGEDEQRIGTIAEELADRLSVML